jgi:aromatic-L-amino-acid decarboxylase
MRDLSISVDDFRRVAQQITELAATYLQGLDRRRTFPLTSGTETERLFREEVPELGVGEKALEALGIVVEHSRPYSPRFFGYVLGSGEPIAATADLLISILNQNVTAWRSAPAAVAIEQLVVHWLADAIGCAGFTGSLTGGGSIANLMALAMAREAQTPLNEKGFTNGVVYASEEVHMSIPKAAALLGLGRRNLRLIEVDANFRMNVDALKRAIQQDVNEGEVPIAVVASAGTVNTGAIDPLEQIAAVARQYDAWFHIDGAYGGLATVAVPEKFKGMNLADSISLDPHKWLYQPLDCGCLLYRDREAARSAFSFTGEYAKSLSKDPLEGFAFFEESVELSRRFRALKLWLSLRYHGLAAFRNAMRADLEHANQLATMIKREPRLELLAPIELSAVCFRHRGFTDTADLNVFNATLLRHAIERGRVYISNASLNGKFCLRACFVNHRTLAADVSAIVEEVLATGEEVSRA